MARFTLPRDIYHGEGALEALKSFDRKESDDLRRGRIDEAIWFPGQGRSIPEGSRHGSETV